MNVFWNKKGLVAKVVMHLLFKKQFGYKQALPLNIIGKTIIGRDNSRIDLAWSATQEFPVKGIVLTCHPFLKYGMHYSFKHKISDIYLKQSYHVVFFNFKGFGGSTVNGPSFADDILSVKDWIIEQFPGFPIYLHGFSFGGYHALHAMRMEPDVFEAAIFDSVPILIDRFFNSGFIGYVMRWLSRSPLASISGTETVLPALSEINGKSVLFIYGSNDPYITRYDLEALKTAFPDALIHMVEGRSHLESHKCNNDIYNSVIMTFLNSLREMQLVS